MRSGPWWPAEFYASVSRGGRATVFNAIHIRNGPNNLGPNTLVACSHIHIQARSHIAVLKPPAQRSSPSSRVVPGRLAVLHTLAERYRPARRKPGRVNRRGVDRWRCIDWRRRNVSWGRVSVGGRSVIVEWRLSRITIAVAVTVTGRHIDLG